MTKLLLTFLLTLFIMTNKMTTGRHLKNYLLN